MKFLRNIWYAALWDRHVPADKPVGRIIAGERIAFWRKTDGTVVAISDNCPHRRAPLSLGAIKGDSLMCRYHGLAFAETGQCTANPYGPLREALNVPHFPVTLRDGMLWVWTGDAERADPALIPEVLAFTRGIADTACIWGYIHARAGHKLFEDNILDPGHGEFLHPVLGSAGMTEHKRIVEEMGGSLKLTILQPAGDMPDFFRPGLPDLDGPAETWIESIWNPNGAMVIRVGATPAGRPREEGADSWTAHIFTPESETTTHYLYASGRSFIPDDEAFNEAVREVLRVAFLEEDLPMIEGQQAVLGDRDLMDTMPQLFSVDRASVQARRMFDRMLEMEAAGALTA